MIINRGVISRPGFTKDKVSLSDARISEFDASSTSTSNDNGVVWYEDGTVTDAVSLLVFSPAVNEVSSVKYEPPPVNLNLGASKFDADAISVIVDGCGFEPVELYVIELSLKVNLIPLAAWPSTPTFKTLTSNLTSLFSIKSPSELTYEIDALPIVPL